MDKVNYREHKILLKAERFESIADFERFWGKVKVVAEACKVPIDAEPRAFNLSVRRISFYDTDAFDLYRSAFILRKRVHYVDGLPIDHELTFKFRHPDLAKAKVVDIRPTNHADPKIKFKEEILQPRDGSRGIRSVFSHNYVEESRELTIHRTFASLTAQFPALASLDVAPDAAIHLVNGVTIEESEAETGRLHFGHGYNSSSSIAVWRDLGNRALIAGEFSFQTKFDDFAGVDRGAVEKSEIFFQHLQSDLPKWLAPGATKTSLIYGKGVGKE